MILRLNMRHDIPRTAIQTQQSRLEESSIIPAELHGNFEQGRSNKGVTQPVTEINLYPTRRAYGARNMTDFTRENGQRGYADARAGDSKRTQEAWYRAENAGKPGNEIAQRAYQEMFAKYSATPRVTFELMPAPEINVTPSRVVGEPEVGNISTEIETTPFAGLRGTQSSFQTYIRNEGYLRRWVTIDKYDIYA